MLATAHLVFTTLNVTLVGLVNSVVSSRKYAGTRSWGTPDPLVWSSLSGALKQPVCTNIMLMQCYQVDHMAIAMKMSQTTDHKLLWISLHITWYCIWTSWSPPLMFSPETTSIADYLYTCSYRKSSNTWSMQWHRKDTRSLCQQVEEFMQSEINDIVWTDK